MQQGAKRIRILVDGYLIDKSRGLGTYVRELLTALDQALQTDDPQQRIDMRVVVPAGFRGKDLPVALKRIQPLYLPRLPQPLWEQILLPAVLMRFPADLIHFPHNTAPLVARWLRPATVCTIHDLMFFGAMRQYVASLRQAFGHFYRRYCVKWASLGCDEIVCVSRKTSTGLADRLGRGSATVYISATQFANTQPREPAAAVQLPFFLHVGGISPHKNTARVLQAFRDLNQPDIALVILGIPRDHPFALDNADYNIIFGSPAAQAEVRWFYQNTLAAVFPSLEEGYGLPIVEAFACAAPVITSNRDPMSELGGDAVWQLDPLDTGAITEALRALLPPGNVATQMRAKGARRYQELGLERMGAAMLSLYLGAIDRARMA